MLPAIIQMLIYICIIALCIYVVLWVLGELGIALPPMVIKIIWIIAVLLVLLMLTNTLLPHLGAGVGRLN